jgi:hypothetical protein
MMNRNFFEKIYKYRYFNIFLIICLFIEIIVLIIKNRLHINLLLSNINDIICCIGFLLFININRKIGCLLVVITFIIYLFLYLYIMPWNFKLLSFLIRLGSVIFVVHETIKNKNDY